MARPGRGYGATGVRSPPGTARALRGPLLLLALAVILLVSAAVGTRLASERPPQIPAAGSTSDGQQASGAGARPNVIVLMTDDQTPSDMRVMSQVAKLLTGRGVRFSNSFVSYPLCCPSRTTALTGQYTHNNGVWANLAVREGYQQFEHQETSLPAALQRAGYRTSHIGKYLNGYGRDHPEEIPPGWSDWHGSIDPYTYRYYGFRLNNNGVVRTYAERREFYSTEVFTRLAISFIQQQARTRQPFFLNLAYLAPHSGGGPTDVPGLLAPPPGITERLPCDLNLIGPGSVYNSLYPFTVCEAGVTRRPVSDGTAIPASEDRSAFDDTPLPRPPSFNEEDISDKPHFMQESGDLPSLTPREIETLTTMYHKRLASLLAVDESVARIVQTLKSTGQLANTVLIFTSDNGFFLGQHRIPFGKYWPYEEAIRVPLIIRGPGLPRGVTRSAPVINVDLAPTILALTRAQPLREMDGRSLLSLTAHPGTGWDRDVLLEGNTSNAVAYEGIRTSRYVYIEYGSGDRELYDLQTDPYELRNRSDDRGYRSVQIDLQTRLERLKSCTGPSCRQ